MATKTIWITRDLENDTRVYIWNIKPEWDQLTCCYNCGDDTCDHEENCCESSVTVLSPECHDYLKIIRALGTTLHAGEMTELKIQVKTTKGIPMGEKAQTLLTKLKSKKKPSQTEITKFLESIATEPDEDQEKPDNSWCR